jgi:hypothetical protein
MSDSQDEHVDTPNRKTEPNPVSRQGDLPAACLNAAAHVASCWHCRTALAARVNELVTEILGSTEGGYES